VHASDDGAEVSVTRSDQEIERKYLVNDPNIIKGHEGVPVVQRYLFNDSRVVIRIRNRQGRFILGIKTADPALVRDEFETEIPEPLGRTLFDSPRSPSLAKTRYYLDHAGTTWTVDVFDGPHAGLILAEIELASPDEVVDVPPWCGAEVTTDPRYPNHQLARYTASPAGRGDAIQP